MSSESSDALFLPHKHEGSAKEVSTVGWQIMRERKHSPLDKQAPLEVFSVTWGIGFSTPVVSRFNALMT